MLQSVQFQLNKLDGSYLYIHIKVLNYQERNAELPRKMKPEVRICTENKRLTFLLIVCLYDNLLLVCRKDLSYCVSYICHLPEISGQLMVEDSYMSESYIKFSDKNLPCSTQILYNALVGP